MLRMNQHQHVQLAQAGGVVEMRLTHDETLLQLCKRNPASDGTPRSDVEVWFDWQRGHQANNRCPFAFQRCDELGKFVFEKLLTIGLKETDRLFFPSSILAGGCARSQSQINGIS